MKCLTYDTRIETAATTQYRRFNFAGMREFAGRYIGINETGLYELTGSDDDGSPIAAVLRTGPSDLGIAVEKRLRHAYLTIKSEGDLEIDIIADDVVVLTRALSARKDKQHRVKVPVGRGAKGVTWSFEVRNVRGENFAIYKIEVTQIALHYAHL